VILCVGLQMGKHAILSSYGCWQANAEPRNTQNLWISKVWREGLEVAMKIKGSQGRKRVKWVKPEHPYTSALNRKLELITTKHLTARFVVVVALTADGQIPMPKGRGFTTEFKLRLVHWVRPTAV